MTHNPNFISLRDIPADDAEAQIDWFCAFHDELVFHGIGVAALIHPEGGAIMPDGFEGCLDWKDVANTLKARCFGNRKMIAAEKLHLMSRTFELIAEIIRLTEEDARQ